MLDEKYIEEIPRKFLENFEKAKSGGKKPRSNMGTNEQNRVVDIDLRDESISDRFDGYPIDLTNVITDAVLETIQFGTES